MQCTAPRAKISFLRERTRDQQHFEAEGTAHSTQKAVLFGSTIGGEDIML